MFEESKYNNKMSKTYELFRIELSSLRTGRANASMLDIVKVDVYGQKMPINQLASITTPEPRSINIQVWDINNVTLNEIGQNTIIAFAENDYYKAILLSDGNFSSNVSITF